MINRPVLVLNQNYTPLNICLVRRAVVLVYQGRAEMLEDGAGFIRTVDAEVPVPTVIRVPRLVKRPLHERRLTRADVLFRDDFTCQYCGARAREITIDHVVPRSQNGSHRWDNVVCACARCNRRKAGRTPQQAGMKLIRPPLVPRGRWTFYIPGQYRRHYPTWDKYLPPGAYLA